MILYLFMAVFFFIVLLMIGLILLQEGKGGGLAGMASGMDGVMGGRNPLRRWTAYFFIAFLVLTIGINKYLYEQSASPIGEGLKAEEPAPKPDLGTTDTEVSKAEPAAATAAPDIPQPNADKPAGKPATIDPKGVVTPPPLPVDKPSKPAPPAEEAAPKEK